MTNSYDNTLFQGTAWYYSRYRAGCPDALRSLLVGTFGLDGRGRMLDLGCGTGQLSIPLSDCFEEVVGMDPDEEMLGEAARLSEETGARNVRWVRGSSEDLSPALGAFRLVTIARAFHWMNRERVLDDLYEMLTAGGGVAIIGEPSFWNPTEPWQERVVEVIKRRLGDERRAGTKTFETPKARHEEVVARSRFERREQHTLSYNRAWTLESIKGYLYSTSFASRRLFGDRVEEFESELERTLLDLNPSGEFRETARLTVILAFKE
jgi:ubiquinone/menaquinone biosynthesis C-methylase UbiE